MKSSGEKSPASSAYAGTVTWLKYPRKIHQDSENVACWVQLLSEITLQVSVLEGPLCDASCLLRVLGGGEYALYALSNKGQKAFFQAVEFGVVS